jgi:hypothetical protein
MAYSSYVNDRRFAGRTVNAKRERKQKDGLFKGTGPCAGSRSPFGVCVGAAIQAVALSDGKTNPRHDAVGEAALATRAHYSFQLGADFSVRPGLATPAGRQCLRISFRSFPSAPECANCDAEYGVADIFATYKALSSTTAARALIHCGPSSRHLEWFACVHAL